LEDILKIKNKEMLTDQVRYFLESIETTDYDLRETYDYTMALPEKYYGLGSYPYWIKVGWALRNINNRLFIVWIEFSAKYEEFNYSSIMELYEKWITFDIGNINGVTRRSIMHWLKMDNLKEYLRIREQSIEYHINESLKVPKCGDVDIANVLYEFYKDQYVCVSIKGDIWYNFSDHRWRLDERGTSLRQHISSELRDVYTRLAEEKTKKGTTLPKEEFDNKIAPIVSKMQEVIKKLGQTTEKDHIMKEAKEKFYDKGGVFIGKLDTNPYILCFKNGVLDFKEKVFRDGRPEDCVSKCTNLKYTPLDESNPTASQKIIMDEIYDFMHKLFPVIDLYHYMWEHLASTLIGTSVNQTFHMYIGKGCNGKSVLMDLMTKTLGEYKGDVPLSIITASRTKPGGLNPELVELKGIRYAVMQEPSPDEKINVGPMKMLTGGKDIIQCRAPYMPETVRYNPQFKLCLCTNTLMKINSLDEGTWRRIRVVEFLAWFTENPVDGDAEKPFQFKLEEIDEKFDSWKEIFISMLVNIAKKTNGVVQKCDRVMQSSNMYKGEQDCVGSFIKEMILPDPMGKIHQRELKVEFEKWYRSMYDERTIPKPKDVYDYFDKKYGKRVDANTPWKGISILRIDETEGECPVEDEEDFTKS
jgi:P4 family phage/plasmid primase-like protien